MRPFLPAVFSLATVLLATLSATSGCGRAPDSPDTGTQTPVADASTAMVYRPDAHLAYNDPAVKQRFLDGVKLLYAERYEEARDLLRPLAEAGHTDAQFFMSRTYMPHSILKPSAPTPFDWQQGIPWLKRAADGGNARAQWLLGDWYYHGSLGRVQRDYFNTDWEKVRHYLRAAADQGLAIAQGALARFYHDSHGVEMNKAAFKAHADEYFPSAWMYYTLASQRYTAQDRAGVARKQMKLDLRDELATRMTAGQLAEARRLTEDWIRTHPDAYHVEDPPELYPPEIYD